MLLSNTSRISTLPLRLLQVLFTLVLLALMNASAAVEPGAATEAEAVHSIIGGNAVPEDYPWMAALVQRGEGSVTNRQFCGGALIAPGWVLTAAHCLRNAAPGDYQVLLGQSNLEAANPVFHDVTEHIAHPFFVDSDNRFDVALIRLATPSTHPFLTLADTAIEEQVWNVDRMVLGWGQTAWREQAPTCTLDFVDSVANREDFACKTFVFRPGTDTSFLRFTHIRLQSYADCDVRYKALLTSLQIPHSDEPEFSASASPDVLCGWDSGEDSSPCYGDSGGPLWGHFYGTNYIFGVTSYGVRPGCVLGQQVGVYARVTYLRDFIEQSMGSAIELGHAQLCPAALDPALSYSARPDGRHDVRMAWTKDAAAEGYRVFYSPHASFGSDVQRIELGADADHISVVLASGQKYFVAVQASSARCDGPLSQLRLVDVP